MEKTNCSSSQSTKLIVSQCCWHVVYASRKTRHSGFDICFLSVLHHRSSLFLWTVDHNLKQIDLPQSKQFYPQKLKNNIGKLMFITCSCRFLCTCQLFTSNEQVRKVCIMFSKIVLNFQSSNKLFLWSQNVWNS